MMKVHGSETLDYVVDEGVQIYGGMGYSAEAPMDRAYRDAYQPDPLKGQTRINRMLTVDMMLKRAMKGELDLMGPAMDVAGELMAIPDFGEMDDSFLQKRNVISLLSRGCFDGCRSCCAKAYDDFSKGAKRYS